MILKEDTFQDTVKGADAELSFSIDTESSVIFEILRDKMYKDKIGSICREVASNSRDANREAGSDKPVEIEILSPNKLLSMGHLSISFKDYGLGISPDKMADIYLKYGASDKRTSDKLTGGFGLGAKTPFAYNDTFTVITICDYEGERRQYTYTAMLDSSGKGKMVLFDSKETENETGTRIIVPIKTSDDRWKFEEESLKYTKTWGDEITYKNFYQSPEKLAVALDNEDCTIYKSGSYLYNTMELLIDGIPYPLDKYMVKLEDTIGRNDSFYLTVLKFNTGDLTISANRESVQYDDETVKTIQNKVLKVQKSLDELLETHVEEQETYLEACMLTFYINRKSSKHLNPPALTGALLAHSKSSGIKIKPTWNGRPTVDSFSFKHHTAFHVTLENGRNKYEPVRAFNFNSTNVNAPIYYGDVRKNSKRNENIWSDGHKSFYIIKPDDVDNKSGIQEFMDFIFTFDIDFNEYSSLEPVKTISNASGTYTKKEYVTLNVREVNKYDSNKKSTIEIDKKTFEPEYTDLDLSKVVIETVSRISNADYLDKSKLNFLSNRGYTTYVVRKRDYEKWLSKTDVRLVSEVYDNEYEKFREETFEKKKEGVLDYLIYRTVTEITELYDTSLDLVRDILPKSCKNMSSSSHSYDEIKVVKERLKFDFDGLETKIKFIFEEKYPLIKPTLREWRLSREDKERHVKLYIKQVNNYYESKGINQ